MTSGGGNKLITVDPEELRFQFELEKACHCDLKVSNATEKYVAFKVKTTSPKKYFVRPNTGVIQPGDTSVIRVTLQPQLEYPPDMQCKDKFLLQSTPVPSMTDTEELPSNTFSKEPGKHLEECKLKVIYIARPDQGNNNSDDGPKQNSDPSSNPAIQTARAARDSAVREAAQLQQELEMLKKRNPKTAPATGFSLKLAIVAGIIGIIVGFILKLAMASPLPPPPPPAPSAAITE